MVLAGFSSSTFQLFSSLTTHLAIAWSLSLSGFSLLCVFVCKSTALKCMTERQPACDSEWQLVCLADLDVLAVLALPMADTHKRSGNR